MGFRNASLFAVNVDLSDISGEKERHVKEEICLFSVSYLYDVPLL